MISRALIFYLSYGLCRVSSSSTVCTLPCLGEKNNLLSLLVSHFLTLLEKWTPFISFFFSSYQQFSWCELMKLHCSPVLVLENFSMNYYVPCNYMHNNPITCKTSSYPLNLVLELLVLFYELKKYCFP